MQDVQLAGDFSTIVENPDGSTTITFDDKGTGRVCGTCQLCCRLVPVPDIGKQAGHKCQHQKYGKGCTIYAKRPFACRTWSCRWLADPSAAGLPRPDRAHYVIDCTWDYVTLTAEDGHATKVNVMQVWCDPAFPDAYKAPELRAYMLKMAETHNCATIVRWSRRDAITIFPPPLAEDGQWHEIVGDVDARNEKERWEARMLGDHGYG